MSLMANTAKRFLAKQAAKRWVDEVLKAGVEDLKVLAETGHSIVGTYLYGCSSDEKRQMRKDFMALLAMGVTIEMVLDEVARQIPEIAPIMKSMDGYRRIEIAKIKAFLEER